MKNGPKILLLLFSTFFHLFVLPCRTIQDPASQRLTWNKLPSSVLVIKKIHDSLIIQPFLDLVQWLIWVRMTFFAKMLSQN